MKKLALLVLGLMLTLATTTFADPPNPICPDGTPVCQPK
jgi:hypothetical protein